MRYLPSKSLSGRVSFSQDKILALGVKCLLNRKIGALRRIVAVIGLLHVRQAPATWPHTRSRVRRSHGHAQDILVGTILDGGMMDASSALRPLDGGTGGRVLSFIRAGTARPTVNQGAGRPRGVLEAGAAGSVRRVVLCYHIRRHYPRHERRFERGGRLIDAGRLPGCLGSLPTG